MTNLGSLPPRQSRSIIIGGITGSICVAASVTASILGLVPEAAGDLSGEASSALSIVETASGTTCDTYAATATCAAVNNYSGKPIARGQSGSIALTFRNTGSVAAAHTLLSLSKVVSNGRSMALTARGNDPMHLGVFKTTKSSHTTIYSGPIQGFTRSISLGRLEARQTETFTFILSNPLTSHTSAPPLSQSMQWQFVQ